MTKFDYLDAQLNAERSPSIIEIAGVSPHIPSLLTVPDAQGFTRALLREQLSIEHPDHGGDLARVRELSPLLKIVSDPAVFAHHFHDLLAEVRTFDSKMRHLINPLGDSPVNSKINTVHAAFTDLLSMPRANDIVWQDLRNVEVIYLDFKELQNFHTKYLNPISLKEVTKEAQRGIQVPPVHPKELREVTESLIAKEIKEYCGEAFIRRAQLLFMEYLEQTDPKHAEREKKFAESIKNKDNKEEENEVAEITLDMWRVFMSEHRPHMTASERKKYERTASQIIINRRILEKEQRSERSREIEETRQNEALPPKFFDDAEQICLRRAFVDSQGELCLDEAQKRSGHWILGSHPARLTSYSAFEIIFHEPVEPHESRRVGIESITELQSLLIELSPSMVALAKNSVIIEDSGIRNVSFDWRNDQEVVLTQKREADGSCTVDALGIVVALRLSPEACPL